MSELPWDKNVKVCTNCGVRNDDAAMFCAACNFFLEWSEDGSRNPIRPITPGGRSPVHPTATPGAASPQSPAPGPSPPGSSLIPEAPPESPSPPAPAPPQSGSRLASAGSPLPPYPSEADNLRAGQHLLNTAVDGLQRGRRLAVATDRNDLADTLDRTGARLDDRTVGVAVVGEFKVGKSTLINALLQTAVCPVDADEVTVVPTLVRYGETPSATAYLESTSIQAANRSSEGDGPLTEPIPVEQIASHVSEAGNPGNRRGLRSVEVRLPRRMLRTGLCLIDTPGVGGLDSAHGIITLGALDLAQGMLFVTDASQELTQPELDFLRQALERCPVAACVVTKTDLYPYWRQIVAQDEHHLMRAGLDLPVIAVSSFLRLASRRDPALTQESGYPTLVSFLARVISAANAVAAAGAARDVEFVAEQIGVQIKAEVSVLEEPAEAERVMARLANAKGVTAGLTLPTANWQQMLSDGVQDLVSDVEFDLQGRLRTVLRDVETIIDSGDPKDSWDDIEAWLRRHVVAAAVENYDKLAKRTRDLATDVGQTFNLDSGGPVELETSPTPPGLALVNLATADSLAAPGGRFGSMLMATRTSLFVPMVLFGVAGGLLNVLVAAPLTVALAAGIGQKIIRDEKKRQVAYRRQQAKFAARRFVEEVGFIMNKESRDALRRTQRLLRDDFQMRATALHRSSSSALQAAQRAITLTDAERSQRVSQLAAETEQLRQVNGTIAQLVASGPKDGTASHG